MDFAHLVDELADLKRRLAVLEGENAALKAERDRLATALETLLPPPTEAEMRDMEANAGKFAAAVEAIAGGPGGATDGR